MLSWDLCRFGRTHLCPLGCTSHPGFVFGDDPSTGTQTWVAVHRKLLQSHRVQSGLKPPSPPIYSRICCSCSCSWSWRSPRLRLPRKRLLMLDDAKVDVHFTAFSMGIQCPMVIEKPGFRTLPYHLGDFLKKSSG